MGHGARGMEHGAWSMGHGAWSKEHGAWSIVLKEQVSPPQLRRGVRRQADGVVY